MAKEKKEKENWKSIPLSIQKEVELKNLKLLSKDDFRKLLRTINLEISKPDLKRLIRKFDKSKKGVESSMVGDFMNEVLRKTELIPIFKKYCKKS